MGVSIKEMPSGAIWADFGRRELHKTVVKYGMSARVIRWQATIQPTFGFIDLCGFAELDG